MCQRTASHWPVIARELQLDGRQAIRKRLGSIVGNSLGQHGRNCSEGTAARHDDLIDTVMLVAPLCGGGNKALEPARPS